LRDGKIFDMPPQTVQRYQVDKKKSEYFAWRYNNKCRSMPQNKKLRVSLMSPALVHWSGDHWQTTQDISTRDTGLGMHVADLPTERLSPGTEIVFTIYWVQEQVWEGVDFSVAVEG